MPRDLRSHFKDIPRNIEELKRIITESYQTIYFKSRIGKVICDGYSSPK